MQVDDFSKMLERDFADLLDGQELVAVAVSGGPDSMALCWLLNGWAQENGVTVHALHVDHGLRDGSGEEANYIAEALSGLSYVTFTSLTWEAEKPEAAVQEEARKARYVLMAEYCKAHDIFALFLAHHMDDQAETVLFRLAKGSGLDGLSGIQAVHDYDENVTLCRPLLGVSKEDLVSICDREGLEYLKDPSNENNDFARVRLRKSRAVLEEEGLSNKRLAVTATRLARAREALDLYAENAFEDAALKNDTQHIEFNLKKLLEQPEEIMLRVILKAMEILGPARDYAPRMEKIESLLYDLRSPETFRKRTLGGVVFERDDKNGVLKFTQE